MEGKYQNLDIIGKYVASLVHWLLQKYKCFDIIVQFLLQTDVVGNNYDPLTDRQG